MPGAVPQRFAFDLSDTRLLITGAAGGIGEATARLCSRLGARIVLSDMIDRRYGRIALCGSIAGWAGGLRAGPHYAASKGGVHWGISQG